MISPRATLFFAVALVPVSRGWAAVKPAPSDLLPPLKRQETVDKAVQLTRPPTTLPVPDNFVSPFSPPNFEQPDREEQKANAAAGIRSPVSGAAASAQAAGPMGDRELLDVIAARIQPTGSIAARGKLLLTFPGKTVGVGQSFLVTYNGQDHELELIAIERTTFTLRLRAQEITRSIKPPAK
ncbi:MAG: hypothetical protein RIQ93_2250 [Verrucomicrobiota bacterium]|jgi:hypothetical protein